MRLKRVIKFGATEGIPFKLCFSGDLLNDNPFHPENGTSESCLLIHPTTPITVYHPNNLSSPSWQPILLVTGLLPSPPGSWSGHGLVRPSIAALMSIKIQRLAFSRETPPSFTFLTPLWTPTVCIFIGNGGQVDEVLWIINLVVSFIEVANLPLLSPLPGQLWACKTQTQAEGDMGRKWKKRYSWWTQRSHRLCVYRISTSFCRWLKEMLSFKEAPGFSLSLLSEEFTIHMTDSKARESAKATETVLYSSLAKKYIATLRETRASRLYTISKHDIQPWPTQALSFIFHLWLLWQVTLAAS